jgi:dTDP-4-amino-4,6-dideoxygalactose transaminase
MSSYDRPITVTQPTLPPLEEFLPYLRSIWESRVLTNGGPMHQQLETELAQYLGVQHVSLFNNATIALLVALKALDLAGEVITTPYSFVATAHSLLWNGIEPVFVDVDPDSLNLDPRRIEAAITPRTTGIMPVHCYGRPCDVAAIKEIADRHRLKVIYDAAHAFGVRDANGSMLNHGDLSVLSFHATKVFNTFEGGAIICRDVETKLRIDRLKNFGIADEVSVVALGINGKMSEINAAFGRLQLRHVDEALRRRARIADAYRKELGGVRGIRLMSEPAGIRGNNGYFPILVQDEFPMTRDALHEHLRSLQIFARRYFHPLISEFPMYRELPSARSGNLRVASDAAARVLCLPIYPAMDEAEQSRVVDVIIRAAYGA